MPRSETVAIAILPLVALTTFAVGLRVGAGGARRTAIVYGAPPASGRAGLSWQVVTVLDDRGVREAVPVSDVTVMAHANGRSSTWRGATNRDGVGEVWLDLGEVHVGDPVSLDIATPTESLARGQARWAVAAWGTDDQASPWARPSKDVGALALDVAVEGQKLVPSFSRALWVRVRDRVTGKPLAGAEVEGQPEPGLSLTEGAVKTCDAGWARLEATPAIHVVGLGLTARAADGRTGEWFGTLPVAPGGASVRLPRDVASQSFHVEVNVPTVIPDVYLEIDDAKGRAFGAILPVAWPGTTQLGRAQVDVPPLDEGMYWLVTSGEPRGAESRAGATVVTPLRIPSRAASDACGAAAELATSSVGRFTRWVALDGSWGLQGGVSARRKWGFAIALGSLATGAALELLLVMRALARSRADAQRLMALIDDPGPANLREGRTRTLNVALGIVLALLGFALLAALVTWRAG